MSGHTPWREIQHKKDTVRPGTEPSDSAWEDMRAYNVRLEERAREAEARVVAAEAERDEALDVREGMISPVQKVIEQREQIAHLEEQVQREIGGRDHWRKRAVAAERERDEARAYAKHLDERLYALVGEADVLTAALERACDETDYCYACDNHPSHGHAASCTLASVRVPVRGEAGEGQIREAAQPPEIFRSPRAAVPSVSADPEEKT